MVILKKQTNKYKEKLVIFPYTCVVIHPKANFNICITKYTIYST